MKKECRLCHANNIEFLFSKEDLEFFRCPDCKLVFLGNILSQKEIENLYSYYANIPQPFNPVTEKRYLDLLRSFEKFRKNTNLLDIGCGGGHFISVAQNRGWNAIGLEISKDAIRICSERNLKVHQGNISEAHFNSNYFDIITMFEVIEHLNEPESDLKKIYEILKPGGLLYITTPNFNSLTRFALGPKWRIFHIEHIFYFISKSIERFLKRIGFSQVEIRSGNLSIVEIKSKIFDKTAQNKDFVKEEQALRNRIDEFAFLNFSKRVCNIFLNIFKLGDTLYIYAKK